MENDTKRRMVRWSSILLPVGILMLITGSVFQVLIFIDSGGNDVIKAPERLVWSGILVAIGIVGIFAGALLRMAGRYTAEDEDAGPDSAQGPVKPE